MLLDMRISFQLCEISMTLLLILAVLSILIGALYLYSLWASSYWKRHGVETIDKTALESRRIINDAYGYFRSKGLKFGGISVALIPIFIPVDLDLIKMILIKDFSHFVNHGFYYNEKADPLSAGLFALENEKWRSLRMKLTPSFTTAKMKMMFQTMVDCTVPLIEVLKQESKIGPINTKDVMARYTSDIIGSAGFGIDCNSLNDSNCEFRQFGKQVSIRTWKTKLSKILPKSVLKFINFRATSQETYDFIMKLIPELIEYREKNNIYRKDFMHSLLQLKNRGKVVDDEQIMDDKQKGEFFTIDQIATQCFTLLLAGFETSAVTITFALLELALEQEKQIKLREEISKVTKKHGGMTYESVTEMVYLDQVVMETLRLHPPAFGTNRVCNKDYKIPDTDVVIEKGTNVYIPIYGVQHDPELYPEPEKFRPERFSPEEKARRHPLAYLAFGEGPRMCIGTKFGVLQTKVGLACAISNFKVTLNPKTKTPIEYNMSSITLSVKGDVWLNFEPLEE